MIKWLCWVALFLCLGFSLKTEGQAIDTASNKAISISSDTAHLLQNSVTIDTLKPRKHKLIAALLALPLPCGVFGLHRLYLGSSKTMPLIYVATLGGGVAILPFIDFVLILINKDVNTYANNTRLFMWTRKPVNKPVTLP